MGAELQTLAGAQCLHFGEGEVLDEPAGDRLAVDDGGPLAPGKGRGGVRRPADLVLVTHHEHAVLRRDDVGLDEIGTHLDGEPVRLERVFGPITGGAAVADNDW